MNLPRALAREQELSALGGQAAAAAHMLGTPLGTINIIAKELVRELPASSPLKEDVDELLAQAKRCPLMLLQVLQGLQLLFLLCNLVLQGPPARLRQGGDRLRVPSLALLKLAQLVRIELLQTQPTTAGMGGGQA